MGLLLTHCGLVFPYGDIHLIIGSGNGLLPEGNKPLPMLTSVKSCDINLNAVS